MHPYVELHCKSNFSFLEGASHAYELVQQAIALEYNGLAITDRNSLAGIVRAHTSAKDNEFRLVVGCELNLVDGPPVVIWPSSRKGYGNLCRLLSLGRLRSTKGECTLSWHDVASYSEDLLAGMIPRLECTAPLDHLHPAGVVKIPPIPNKPWCRAGIAFDTQREEGWQQWLNQFRDLFGDRGWLMAHQHLGIDDVGKLHRLAALGSRAQVPLLAGGDVLYHVPERMILHDCLLAIASGTTVETVARFRPMNAQHALQSRQVLSRRFADYPEALTRTLEVAERADFNLDLLKYEYPVEATEGGLTPIEYLKKLTWEGARERYPDGIPDKVVGLLKSELGLIEELAYEAYFLTVYDIVRYARSRDILCQGRGSAANSATCFCLGITSVDPEKSNLLFARFISRERKEVPDIDVDFEHNRREEVLQYVYNKYGRDRVGMTATVIRFRSRSAMRDCGKALGVSADCIDRLTKMSSGMFEEPLENRFMAAGIDPSSPIGARYLYLVESLKGFPRQLSQHVGGMVMTRTPLLEFCPIENAAMADRTVVQWDKDDLEELGILKVDCLGLGMLTALHISFDLLKAHYQRPLTLASIPPEESVVYDMICEADTIGVFQIESRAQMSMLPRLQPRKFYDLVIEVAIVRPGPVQGKMVHPYLTARRTGIEPDYPTEEIRQVLRRTSGVPLFQEQAMELAMTAAGFTPDEADKLRRSMASWRSPGYIEPLRRKLLEGMQHKGLAKEFAERVFEQIKGFGAYGFPESHAASFALLVYASAWIKCHYPEVFCCALLNSQPLGFYAPAQLIQDAQRHNVIVLPPDVNRSDWDSTLEVRTPASDRKALRLGLRMVRGLSEEDAACIVQARCKAGIFLDQTDLVRRARLTQAALARLADAGALDSLSSDRRSAYWQALAQEQTVQEMPLFDAMNVDCDEEVPETLRPMSLQQEIHNDYATLGLSLKGHPMAGVRELLNRHRVTLASQLPTMETNRLVRVAGIVLSRQRPQTAKGVIFVGMEDESGMVNLILHTEIWKEYRLVCKQSNVWFVHGILQNQENVRHVIVKRVQDLKQVLGSIPLVSRDFH